MLKLLNVSKKPLDLVAGFANVVIQLGVHLITALNLGLQVFDRAVDVPQRTLLRTVLGFLVFKMGLQLFSR